MMLRRDYRRSVVFGTAAFTAVFLFMALAVAALLSFDAGASAASIMDAYTLRILRFTLYQATLSTFLSIVLGLPVALALCWGCLHANSASPPPRQGLRRWCR